MNATNDRIVIQCGKCGAKNRIPREKTGMEAKCGKCGETLGKPDPHILRCSACGSRNRVWPDQTDKDAKCGKCGALLKTDVLFTQQPFLVTEANFDEEVLKSPIPAMVFAWAQWCPTCRTSMPAVDEFAKDAKGKIRVGKLNVDNNPSLSSKFNILSVPLILVFDNGQMKESFPGALQQPEIMIKMAPYL